jgi:hypothetical protein
MAQTDPLPTEQQRERLCDMIACAFGEVRMLGWAGRSRQAAALADAFHNLPRDMYRCGLWRWEEFREDLLRYQAKYKASRDYVALLDEIRGMA